MFTLRTQLVGRSVRLGVEYLPQVLATQSSDDPVDPDLDTAPLRPLGQTRVVGRRHNTIGLERRRFVGGFCLEDVQSRSSQFAVLNRP